MPNIQKIGIVIFFIFAVGGGTIAVFEFQKDKFRNNIVENNGENSADLEEQAFSANTQNKRLVLLEAKIEALQSRLDVIEDNAGTSPPLDKKLDKNSDKKIDEELAQEQTEQPNFAANFRRGPGSMTTNLIAVGIDPLIAEQIEGKRSELELARLMLRDKASRGGYLNQDQYREELNALNEEEPTLREEIGDSFYDRFLYTSGQSNRISISSVMTGSAAEGAGIRDGDLLVSYAGQRLFRWQELRGITSGGVSGEIVDVRVIRDGNEISLNLPRGPLGVRLNQKRVDPDPS